MRFCVHDWRLNAMDKPLCFTGSTSKYTEIKFLMSSSAGVVSTLYE